MTGQLYQGEHRSIHDPIEALDQDMLGRQALAQTILERLCTSDVRVLGIYGGWGTGKTSLLNLLTKLNDRQVIESGRSDLHIEVIDAWKYEMTGSLFMPIIVALKKFAEKETLSEATTKKYLKRVGKIAVLGASDIILKKLGLSIQDVRNLINDTREISPEGVSYLDWENLVDEVESTCEAFGELIKVSLQGLGKNGYQPKRIIFCIDNLDRCSPENAINLLESVKNFLMVPSCIWLFAVDPDVIASYIYKKYEGTAVDGNSYLDKIIPEQYHLSVPFSSEYGGHLDEFLREITRELPFAPQLDWKRFAHIPRIWRPRRLIKCARSLLSVHQTVGNIRQLDIVFALILLYHTWPDFYEVLSFGLESHVGGVLVNFAPEESNWMQYKEIAIHNKFINDPDLRHFLQKAIMSQYEDNPRDLIRDVISATDDLRQAGLP